MINQRIYVLISLILLLPARVFPQTETIFASYRYMMGDNDTKKDARRICFIEAKRLCLEKAGTYIESDTQILNMKLSRDAIKTIAAALIKVEIDSEKIEFANGSLSIFMSVKATVVKSYIEEKLKEIESNKEIQNQIISQQNKIAELELKVKNMQTQLLTDDTLRIEELREKRSKIFNEIDELEKIRLEIKSKTTLAVENIELGMTPEEVIKIVGKPRATDDCLGEPRFNYGNVWVIFNGGVVSCLVKAQYYHYVKDRESYRILSPPGAIIK